MNLLPRMAGKKYYDAFNAAKGVYERIEAGQKVDSLKVACFGKPDMDFLQAIRENLDKLGLQMVDVMYAVFDPDDARNQGLPKYKKYIPCTDTT